MRIYSLIFPQFVHKTWHAIHTALCLAFFHFTRYLVDLSISALEDFPPSFPFTAAWYSIVWTYHNLINQSSIVGYCVVSNLLLL